MGTMEIFILILVTGVALMLFGYLYNKKVEELERDDDGHGYVSFLVVGGVAATLVAIGLIDLVVDWNAGLIGLYCFSCSGAPMVVGSMERHMKRSKAKEQALHELAKERLEEDA